MRRVREKEMKNLRSMKRWGNANVWKEGASMGAEGEEGLPVPRPGPSLSSYSAIRRADQGVAFTRGCPV